jgi:hypothetical protein
MNYKATYIPSKQIFNDDVPQYNTSQDMNALLKNNPLISDPELG